MQSLLVESPTQLLEKEVMKNQKSMVNFIVSFQELAMSIHYSYNCNTTAYYLIYELESISCELFICY